MVNQKPALPLPAANPETNFFWKGARLDMLMVLPAVPHLRPLCQAALPSLPFLGPVAGSGFSAKNVVTFTEACRPFHLVFFNRVLFLSGRSSSTNNPGFGSCPLSLVYPSHGRGIGTNGRVVRSDLAFLGREDLGGNPSYTLAAAGEKVSLQFRSPSQPLIGALG